MTSYVNQHLTIDAAKFLIIPNCGKGDCLFKAISQAVYDGSDRRHLEVRIAVVDYVISKKWDFLKETIEVQHVQQNEILQKAWTEDPVSAYRNYMTSPGALGSMSELAAAAGVFNFNFVTVQEYNLTDGFSYRVENCKMFGESQVPLYFFFFTGDFDNGHWEYLHPIGMHRTDYLLADGIHYGRLYPVINGEECSLEKWLKIHTENTNSLFDLKCNAFTRIPASTDPQFPFDSEIQLEKDGMIELHGEKFRIHQMKYVDLFSVITSILFKGCDQEATISQLEVELLEYRIENFSSLNDKLIRQPYSNGFNLNNLKYLSMPCKGNVQDLVAASCIRGFSFKIYFETSQFSLESCTFDHTDRWGDKSNKMLYFFMKLVNNPNSEETIAKWWHLVPDKKHSRERDLNENFLSGGSSSDATDRDEHVRKVEKNGRKFSSGLKIEAKEELTRSTPQQTENKEDDLSEQFQSLTDTSTEEKGKEAQSSDYFSSSGSESCVKLGTTVVETHSESTNVSEQPCEKTLSKDSSMLQHATIENRKSKDANNNICEAPRLHQQHKQMPSQSATRCDTSRSASIVTVQSDSSLLKSRFNSQWRPREQGFPRRENNSPPVKKSLWRTFIQKCLPCANPEQKQDVWFNNK